MSRWFRRLAYALGTLVVLVVVLAGFVVVKSNSMLTKKYNPPNEPITVRNDSVTLARGTHLVTVISKCVQCHGDNLGGKPFIDDPKLGHVIAPNLTKGKGGVGNRYTDEQMAVVIRHGIKADSTTALVMPSDDYEVLSDDDVAAIVAYVRSVPPVDHELPRSTLGPLGRALSATGQFPVFVAELVDHNLKHVASVTVDTSVAYGSYLAHAGGCTGCHGPGLSGGKIPGTPPEWPAAANLTPKGIGHYTDTQITEMLRSGTRPDGTHLNDVMPWKFTAKMTDDEIATTVKYLRTVPAKEFGGR